MAIVAKQCNAHHLHKFTPHQTNKYFCKTENLWAQRVKWKSTKTTKKTMSIYERMIRLQMVWVRHAKVGGKFISASSAFTLSFSHMEVYLCQCHKYNFSNSSFHLKHSSKYEYNNQHHHHHHHCQSFTARKQIVFRLEIMIKKFLCFKFNFIVY